VPFGRYRSVSSSVCVGVGVGVFVCLDMAGAIRLCRLETEASMAYAK
jgi:hypothetical protein